jgi:hypothetical protein
MSGKSAIMKVKQKKEAEEEDASNEMRGRM